MRKLSIFFILIFSLQGLAQINLINTGVTCNIIPLSVINNTIVISGVYNYLVKSVDNCENLTSLVVPVPANYYSLISRPDANTIYMISTLAFTNQKIHKSTDGGYSWTKKYEGNNSNYRGIKFFDGNEGFTTGINQLLRTRDGGNTWTVTPSPFTIASAFEVLDSIACLGGSNGGTGVVALSKDRGKTWISVANFGDGTPTDFFFLNKDTIFGCSLPSSTGIAFVKSTNGGANWQKQGTFPLSYQPWAVYFKNRNEGYMVGQDLDDSLGLILKTIDLGQSWSSFKTPFKAALSDIIFLNDSVWLISGTNGLLFKWNSKQALFTRLADNDFENSGIKVFPNPVKDKLNIQITNPRLQNGTLEVINALGQTVYQGVFAIDKQEIDFGGFESGIYFLRVQNDSGRKVIKVMKE